MGESVVDIFAKQNPGWTLKLRSCGHFEPEPNPNPGYQSTTYYKTATGTQMGPAPSFCGRCATKAQSATLEYSYWTRKWQRFKEKMENG